MSPSVLQSLIPYAPLYMVALALVAVILRAGPAFLGRWNERLRDKATERDSDWKRLRGEIERHTEEIKALKAENADCHLRLSALEGYQHGLGVARQEAQIIVSAERAKKNDPPKAL